MSSLRGTAEPADLPRGDRAYPAILTRERVRAARAVRCPVGRGGMRSIWRGAVSFGLVSIGVKLYSATEDKDIRFHQVHATDGGRVKYKRVCSIDGEEVEYRDIAKGYELPDGQVVILTDEDFDDLPLSTRREIEVLEFVDQDEIDPIMFEKTYYLEPEGPRAPYVLLREALENAGRSRSPRSPSGSGSRSPRCACWTASWCCTRCGGPTRSAVPTSPSSTRTSASGRRN